MPYQPSLTSVNEDILPALTTLKTRRHVIKDLMVTVPKNAFGLPTHYYRTDLIPDSQTLAEMDYEERLEQLNLAKRPIHYIEGFPSQDDGRPLWASLDFEPANAFLAFEAYLRQADEYGSRQLHLLVSDVHTGEGPAQFLEYFHLYYWELRSRAYDIFETVKRERQRSNQLMQADSAHYLQSQLLLDKLQVYFDELTFGEDGTELDPKDAVAMMEKLVKMQRTALHAPAQSAPQAPALSQVDATKQVAVMTGEAEPENDNASESNGSDLQTLLEDEETAALAQELVMRTITPSTSNSNVGGDQDVMTLSDEEEQQIAEDLV